MSNSLSSKKMQQKKGSAKKGLRNVLALPGEKYWPVLENDQDSRFQKLLSRLLPGLKRESKAIPWTQLRKMSKEERWKTRQETQKGTERDVNENTLLKSVVMGVNAVTRGLEKDNLCSVLLDSSVESLLIKHVVVMAKNKGVAILLVPFLKKLSLENIGFATAALGLKTNITESGHPLNDVHREIVKYSPPDPSARKGVLSETTKDVVEDVTKNETMSMKDENSSPKPGFTISKNVYKYRSTRKERTFVPPGTDEKARRGDGWSDYIGFGDNEVGLKKVTILGKNQRYMDVPSQNDKKSVPEDSDSDGFVAFGSEKEEPTPQEPKNTGKRKNMAYLPLKVKRVQGCDNRVKATKTPKQKNKSVSNKS